MIKAPFRLLELRSPIGDLGDADRAPAQPVGDEPSACAKVWQLSDPDVPAPKAISR
jgi:hypothetical protein